MRQRQALHGAADVEQRHNAGCGGRLGQGEAVDECGCVGGKFGLTDAFFTVQLQQKKRSDAHEFAAEGIDNLGAAPA